MDSTMSDMATRAEKLQATKADTLIQSDILLPTQNDTITTTNEASETVISDITSGKGHLKAPVSQEKATTDILDTKVTKVTSASEVVMVNMNPMEKLNIKMAGTEIRKNNSKAKMTEITTPQDVPQHAITSAVLGIRPSRKMYEIRKTNKKGLAMFTTTKIPRGTLILAESPILRITHGDYTPKIVQEEFEKLSAAAKDDFMALHSVHNMIVPHPSEKYADLLDGVKKDAVYGAWAARTAKQKSVYSVFLGNSMCSDAGAAVFRDASHINHSCVPNCNFVWRADEGMEHIRTLRDVKAGEEITICYIDPLLDPHTRTWCLRRTYGFDCECKACVHAGDPFSFAAKSRDRRWRLRELDDRKVYLENDVAREFNDKLEMIILMREEEMCLPKVAECYLRISHICKQKGDLVKSHKAAALAFDTYAVCLGPDSTSSLVAARWQAKLELEVSMSHKPKDDAVKLEIKET